MGCSGLYGNVTGCAVQACPASGMLVDGRPGKRTGVPDNVTVDEIAYPPEDLSHRRKQHASVERHQRVDAFNPRSPEERGNDEEDCSKEGHAPLPGGEDMLGLREIVRYEIWLLHDKVQATADQSCRQTPPQYPVHDIRVNTLVRGIAANGPQAHDDAYDIHQPVPAQRQWTEMDDHRIDIDVDIGRADP